MYARTILTMLFIAAAFILAGCQGGNDTGDSLSAYFPLDAAKKWSWEYADNIPPTVSQSWQWSCMGQTTFLGHSCYVLGDPDSPRVFLNWVSNQLVYYGIIPYTVAPPQGTGTRQSSAREYDPPYIRIPQTLRAGYTWIQEINKKDENGTILQTFTVHGSVDEVGTSVTVPVGTFSNAIQITLTEYEDGEADYPHIYWYVPNVGLVKEDYYLFTDYYIHMDEGGLTAYE